MIFSLPESRHCNFHFGHKAIPVHYIKYRGKRGFDVDVTIIKLNPVAILKNSKLSSLGEKTCSDFNSAKFS